MEGKAARYVLGWCVTVVTGVMLQVLWHRFGGPILAVLVPVNESPWELGKLCFWPYLPGALLLWRMGDASDSRGGHCALLLLMPLMMVVLCALLGVDSRQESVLIWLAVLTVALVLYALVLRRCLWGGELLWYTLAILLGIAYLLLTALPPMGGIFTDPADVSAMLTIPV